MAYSTYMPESQVNQDQGPSTVPTPVTQVTEDSLSWWIAELEAKLVLEKELHRRTSKALESVMEQWDNVQVELRAQSLASSRVVGELVLPLLLAHAPEARQWPVATSTQVQPSWAVASTEGRPLYNPRTGEKLSDVDNIAIASTIPASDSSLLCLEPTQIESGVQWLMGMVPRFEQAIDLSLEMEPENQAVFETTLGPDSIVSLYCNVK